MKKSLQESTTVKHITFIVLAFVYILFFFTKNQWETAIIAGGDQVGYYSYLPALFIYHDIKTLDTSTAVRYTYTGIEDFNAHDDRKIENGNFIITYTAGVAIIESIPFLIGHLWAAIDSRYPADGYSFPYAICITFWSIVLLFIAFWLFTGILERYVSWKIALITVLFEADIFRNSFVKTTGITYLCEAAEIA